MARRKYLSAVPLVAVSLACFASPAFAALKKQSIKFTSTPPSNATVGGPTYTVTARASSKEPVTFTSGTPTICTVSGSTVSFIAVGPCTIDANQAGNSEYEPAPQETQEVKVGKGTQTIAFESTPPSAAIVGGSYSVKASASPSGLPVTISAGPSPVCTLSGSTVSFTGIGTCTVDANQAGNANYNPAEQQQQSFSIKGTQTITFESTPPSPAQAGGSYAPKASTTSHLTVTFSSATEEVCTVVESTVIFKRAGECKVEGHQGGNAEYTPAAPVSQLIGVERKPQTVGFTSAVPNPAVVGDTYAPGITVSSGQPVALSSATPSICTVSGATASLIGAGTCTLNASLAETGEWAGAQAQQSFTVDVAPPLIITPSPPPAPIVQIKPPVILPDSNFKVVSASLSLATYSITFVEAVNNPGRFSWVLTFENGKFGVYSASAKAKKCKDGWIRLQGSCRPLKVLFARGSETVASAGSVTFTVKPTRAGISALRKAFKQNRGLPVTAYVTFQSARGGAPVARVQSLIVKGRR